MAVTTSVSKPAPQRWSFGLSNIPALLFSLPPEKATFDKLGFVWSSEVVRAQLERVAHSFLGGYNAMLRTKDIQQLVGELDSLPGEFRGFAFEGAGMAAYLVDSMRIFGGGRLAKLLELTGDRYTYLIYIGIGWAWAKLPISFRRLLGREQVVYKWLAVDGMGFHEGFFSRKRCVEKQRYPRGVSGYACHAFDHGLGRSLWFSCGAQPRLIASTIERFPESRRGDLWSGVGLACAYAGGVEPSVYHELRNASGQFWPSIAQGAAFAAEARVCAGASAPWTDLACGLIWDESIGKISARVRAAGENLPSGSETEPPYEVWRARVKAQHQVQ